MRQGVTIRHAERSDVPIILRFIRELATYENMLDEVVADEALLEEWIFDKQKAEVLLAVVDGREVGFALFFHNFSTFLGRAGHLPRGPVRTAGISRVRLWHGAAQEACRHCRRAWMWSPGVVMSGLERAIHRLLLVTWCQADGRVDGLSDHRRCARRARETLR